MFASNSLNIKKSIVTFRNPYNIKCHNNTVRIAKVIITLNHTKVCLRISFGYF